MALLPINSSPGDLLAIDYGAVRVGIARASEVARLPEPLVTLTNDEQLFSNLQALIERHHVSLLIVGYPRGLNGQSTDQTAAVDTFITELSAHLSLPIVRQDEALSSRMAKSELALRKRHYQKSDVDALAAAYILEDYLASYQKET